MATNGEVAILNRVIEPENDDLLPEVARYLLKLDFPEADRRRMDELAAKARAGELSEREKADLEGYRHVSHLLALLQSKARKALSKSSPAP